MEQTPQSDKDVHDGLSADQDVDSNDSRNSSTANAPTDPLEKEPSFFGVIVHSFFVIPFLIAVFCLLLFTAVSLLTREQKTVQSYLEDVRTGGSTKRWQSAFELSKILSGTDASLKDERFTTALIKAFKDSIHDDDRVRQYLALAMGRTAREEFFSPLTENIAQEKESTLPSILYALGMLKSPQAVPILENFLNNPKPEIRSIAVVALGNIGDPEAKEMLRKSLSDEEANVKWGASLSLASLGDNSGKEVLAQLLNRKYFSQFPEVDQHEQVYLMLAAIQAVVNLKEESLYSSIQSLGKDDSNMKVRAAAMKAVEEFKTK